MGIALYYLHYKSLASAQPPKKPGSGYKDIRVNRLWTPTLSKAMLSSNRPLFKRQEEEAGLAFASQGLKKTKMSNYCSMKLELLALKWVVAEKFREYLQGSIFLISNRQQPLQLLADNGFSSYGTTIRTASMASFNFGMEYPPGTVNCNSEALPNAKSIPAAHHGITVKPQVAYHHPQGRHHTIAMNEALYVPRLIYRPNKLQTLVQKASSLTSRRSSTPYK